MSDETPAAPAPASASAPAADGEAAVLTDRRGHVLVITLNRPDQRNAVNGAIAKGLEAAIDLLEDDDDLWIGVLTGNGKVFCAGADLKMISAGRMAEAVTAKGDFAGFVRRQRTKPVIAALNGDALAGGFEITIACDLIVAPEGGRVSIPEVKRSLLAMAGALARLPQLIGEKLALEMALTGAPYPVERFETLGLISKVVPADAVLDTAVALAEQIAANAPLAVRASRAAIVDGRDLDEMGRWKLAVNNMAPLYSTDDFREGPRAFVEKRAPHWTGR